MPKITIPTDKISRLKDVQSECPGNPIPGRIFETLTLLADLDAEDDEVKILLLTRHDLYERLLIEREILGKEFTVQGQP